MVIKLSKLNSICRKFGFVIIINVDLEYEDNVIGKPTEIIIMRWKNYLKNFC